MDVVVHVSLTSDRLTWHLMARLAGSASGFCSCPIQSLVSDAPHQRSTMPYRINGREKTGSANIMAFLCVNVIDNTINSAAMGSRTPKVLLSNARRCSLYMDHAAAGAKSQLQSPI